MKAYRLFFGHTAICGCALFLMALLPVSVLSANNQILGWNNLGMHCMDSDYSVFSILPPYNTIESQLIVGGKLVTNAVGYTVTYEAVADSDGSINKTSIGKGNWSQFAEAIYGANLAPDTGLLSWKMPGLANTPQSMTFEQTNQPAPASAPSVLTKVNWFRAEGIPLTPYDDAGHKNPYPMMRLIARDAANQPIATNDIVLPVSDEMDCRACHASGTQDSAKPSAGWVWSDNPERDYRLNILRLHDEQNFTNHTGLYQAALAARGFNPLGLYRGVVADGKPVLCAICHASEALGIGSYSNTPPLTASVHSFHAHVADPDLHITLDNAANRAACYRCHPGSATKCLRGAMGGAIATDGTMAMQCQSCHGNMSQVGSSSRVGWFMEPNCQSCHTGTATHNNGQIRYTSAFTDTNWTVRVPVDQTFAAEIGIPATGLSLYRFSAGHGGLQCSACHGSTHAEFPATHQNDNVRNIAIQGHAGVMIECTACHTTTPNTGNGGPHGMHPIGQSWATGHESWIHSLPGGAAACQICHGLDFRGTVLSQAQTTRSITVDFDGNNVTLNLFRGALIGCYNCHNGPASENINNSAAPTAANVSASTTNGQPVNLTLPITGAGAVARIISQPGNGSVGLSSNTATYFPDAGFVGTNTFTFAAWNGSKNSLLATGTVVVVQGSFSVTAQAHVPTNYPVNWPVPFAVTATAVNVNSAPTYQWNFGDGSVANTNQYPTHAYASPGSFNWSVISAVQSGVTQVTATNTGTIVISAPMALLAVPSSGGDTIQFSWPLTLADVVLESSSEIGAGANWTVCTNGFILNGGNLNVIVPNTGEQKFYRLRKL